MESFVTEKTEKRTATCIHCGTVFKPAGAREDFCCAGCEFVHSLIRKNNLGQYYDLRDQIATPVGGVVFRRRDYRWLRELADSVASKPESALKLDIQGISCLGCVWLIEKLWERHPGALSIRVDSTLGRIDVRWKTGEFDIVEFARELQSYGYTLGPARKEDSAAPDRGLVLRLGLCGAFALNSMLYTLPRYLGMERSFQFAALFDRLTLVFSTLSLVFGGSYFIARSWRSLNCGVLHIDLPISLGLIAAYIGSLYGVVIGNTSFVYLDFVSIFAFLMLAGRWVQQRSIEQNRNRLLSVHSEPPRVLLADGLRHDASIINKGMKYSVETGQHVPVRSKLLSDAATFGMEWINGESDASIACAGQLVGSGAMNLGVRPVELEAAESWSESMLARLIAIQPPNLDKDCRLEKLIRLYILTVGGIAIAGFGSWLAAGASVPYALQVFVSVLVVSCPCALGVALPMADELAASRLRDLGLFVRDYGLWSRLRHVRKIVFDKTGTITLETMALRNPESLNALSSLELAMLARMVSENLHPVSCCLREFVMAKGVDPARGEMDISEFVGFGVQCEKDGRKWRLGRPDWAWCEDEYGVLDADCAFSCEGKLLAVFRISEDVRPDAAAELEALQRLGYEVHLLSGDRAEKVAVVAGQLGLPAERCRPEMSPQGKADWIRTRGGDVLMIGDGANDSLAFNESLCRGTPAVDRGLLEQKADFYFLGQGISSIRHLFEIAAQRRNSIRSVVIFALVYNVVALAICLSGKMNPLIAAILMPISSLISLTIVFAGQNKVCRTHKARG